jgi:protein SCO1
MTVKTLIANLLPLIVLASSAWAQPLSQPPILKDIGIDQKLNAQVPADLIFRDETGREIKLGDYFAQSHRPIVLTLVYYECPMLCSMVLNEVVRTMNGLSTLSAGKDYDVLTISFDPRETTELAAAKRKGYLREYKRASGEQGWHFLTGSDDSIRRLTEAVGFRYAWDPKFNQYVHASGFVILTPQGKVSRYFYGLDYSVKDVRLSLVEASNNQIGSPVEQVMLYCFHYDPSTGKYSLAILNLLKAAAALTVLGLGSYVLISFRRDRRAASAAESSAAVAAARGGGELT